ncbi:helix-turn-helix transcriptional regulator [Kibdelosporangium persicum]|uniref:HTH cro/C1-type domain-containing protein n=1 Tax=Kibdelosporangium persicum TaxID=2698649 RepID=A0ABX2FF04_9PSEU|nr:helix-turn-helix transcriptional regulator [Kibdelosporangium persicum]NRN69315.1 HTH cro/C1-type domain-containing protein [Kibdelosporangium persicum]
MDANKKSAALRELGALLRSARKQAQLTQRALASAAGFKAHSRISEIENGESAIPSTGEVERLLDALGTDLDERERAIGLLAQATDNPSQLSVGPAVINETMVQLIDHERAARRITAAGPLLLPGLVQTSDYSRAIFGGMSDIEAHVALRAGRRDILVRRNPVDLFALIDSEALVRPVIPPDEMAYQLRHILKLAELPNVVVQVVPSLTTGYHPMLAGQFELIEFATASPIVLLDHHYASVILRDPDEVAKYVEDAEYLRTKVALSPDESVKLIAEILYGME